MLSKFGTDRITVSRSLRRLGAMGWSKHSIPTGFRVIKSDLNFGEARDAAMKTYYYEVRCGNEGAIHVCNNCMVVHCEMEDGRINSSPLRNEMGGTIPVHCEMKHSIGSELQATEKYQIAKSKHVMKTRRMNSSQFKCFGSLGWDISGSYHVLQLSSSLTSRSTAISETERSQLLNILYQVIIVHHIFQQRKVHLASP